TLLQDGRVLIVGGYYTTITTSVTGTTYHSTILKNAEIYDPIGRTFSLTGDMAQPRAYHQAVLLPNGRVLVVGGGSAEVYDPVSGKFTGAGSSLGTTATLLKNGKLLITGGLDTLQKTVANAELYDPSTGKFSLTGPYAATGNNSGLAYPIATLLANGTVL